MLGFAVANDDCDGNGDRQLRMFHSEWPGLLLALKSDRYLLNSSSRVLPATTLDLVPIRTALRIIENENWYE